MSNGLPSAVQNFIADHIDSIEQLEVLLHLRSGKRWTVDELSVELRSSPRSIRKRLDDLCELNLARKATESPETFEFHARDEWTSEVVGELAAVYRQYRSAVIDLIFRKPKNKMLNFSRAFRIKGDEDGE